MQGIGIVIGVCIFIIIAILPLVTIIIAKYITLFEKIIWLGFYVLGAYLMIIYLSNGLYFLSWTLFLFIMFKISYARRKAIWSNKMNLK